MIGNQEAGVTTKAGNEAKYRIEMRAPTRVGKYTVDVVSSRGKDEPKRVIGRGEVEVK